MKIIYIGNFKPQYSTENDVKEGFETIGHEVITVQENMPHEYRKILTYDFDMLLITGTWSGIIPLTQWLDIIKECANRGIPTATLHLDTFWSTGRGGRKWWHENMFHTAYIFTADGDYQEKWKLLGKNHIWLPPAVRGSGVYRGKKTEKYNVDIAFVGSNGRGYHEDVWPYRRQLVDNLREMAKKNGWTFMNPGGDHPKVDRSGELNDFYASAKVCVGDSLCLLKEKSHYWSDRVPESWGRGAFLIMPQIDAIKEQGIDQPFYKWGDFENLEAQIKKYLKSEKMRETKISKNLQEVKASHTYASRAQTILREVGFLNDSH